MRPIEIRRTADGRIQARRKDGQPLTPEDREEARRMAETQDNEALGVRESDTIRAVKICSHFLKDEIWLILDRSFIPNDGLASYYAEEIPLLKNKSPEELREIQKVKLAFPGCRVIQEGAEGLEP